MIPEKGKVTNDQFFSKSQIALFELANNLPNTSLSDFQGITLFQFDHFTVNMTFDCVEGCLNQNSTPCFPFHSQECNAIRYFF